MKVTFDVLFRSSSLFLLFKRLSSYRSMYLLEERKSAMHVDIYLDGLVVTRILFTLLVIGNDATRRHFAHWHGIFLG